VTVSAGSSAPNPTNRLRSLRFRNAKNALIDIGGQLGRTGDFDLTLTGGIAQTSFTVRRAASGQSTTVPFTVVDDCGDWSTLVGGGPTAF